jgi:HAD superfamily hydrolase (TIGR01490 family)
VRIVFFDMDHTLIAGDCDVLWKRFLADRGLAGCFDRLRAAWHHARYRRGRLDIEAFLRFQLRQFRGRTVDEMAVLAETMFDERAAPLVYPAVPALLTALRSRGLRLVLVTATNGVLARPLAAALGLEGPLATRLALADGRYTGRISGPYLQGEGKLAPIGECLAGAGLDWTAASYWGDSVNDIPVLARVGYPVAANPDPALAAEARRRGWAAVDLAAPLVIE